MPVQSGKEIANDFRKSREIQIIAFPQKIRLKISLMRQISMCMSSHIYAPYACTVW